MEAQVCVLRAHTLTRAGGPFALPRPPCPLTIMQCIPAPPPTCLLVRVDMCWGNVWPTAARRTMASFSSTISVDRFFLIVRREEEAVDDSDWLTRPFEPFTFELWVYIFCAFAIAGIMVTFDH